MDDLAVVVLAAGHGTRMLSKRQKVLHEVGGKPMVQHVFETAQRVSGRKPLLVVSPGETGVRDLLGDAADYVEQTERLGTGHATLMAAPMLQGHAARVAVTYADMPLLQAETLATLAGRQEESAAAVVLLTIIGDPASTFGRVLRDEHGRVAEIVEVAQARRRPDSAELLAIREQNAGVYCFDAPWLWKNLPHLPLRQARTGPEYYLTDLIEMAVQQGRPVEAVIAADADEGLGAGTRAELATVEQAFRRRTARKWLEAGVTLIDPAATYIDPDVQIGRDTIIWPNTYLQGHTHIGEDCRLGPNAIIRDATLGPACVVEQAVVEGMLLPAGTHVPPFSHLSSRSEQTNDQ